jgi:hypothetical protein
MVFVKVTRTFPFRGTTYGVGSEIEVPEGTAARMEAARPPFGKIIEEDLEELTAPDEPGAPEFTAGALSLLDENGLNALRGVKGVHMGAEEKPDTVTLDDVRKWCDREERVLRLQYRTSPDERGELPPEWEIGLKLPGRQIGTMTGALSRWAYLIHLYRIRNQKLAKAEAPDVEEAIRQLLLREPIVVEMPSRTVAVTGRSYSAMLEIARHSVRLHELETDVLRIAGLEQRLLVLLISDTPKIKKRRASRRLRWLYRVHRRVLMEAQLHRQALYAHATTDDGAPAGGLADAPDWWDQMTPEDDAALLRALFAVGVERYANIPDPPERDEEERKPKEDFGWHSLFASVERSAKLKPASLYDRDLFQLLTWVRTGHTSLEDELD